jgi:ankyrin repeat protein
VQDVLARFTDPIHRLENAHPGGYIRQASVRRRALQGALALEAHWRIDMSESLLHAAQAGDVARVRTALAEGADPDARDADGATALMHAAHAGRLDAVRALIAGGADVNAKDARGWAALMKAAHNPELDRGFPDVVQALIDAGADIEAPIGYGIRPLMLAAGYGETAVVEALLRAGANVLARNDGGLTALMMVKEKFYVDVINLLHEAERDAGVEEGSCTTKNAPGSNVVTFLKPMARGSTR